MTPVDGLRPPRGALWFGGEGLRSRSCRLASVIDVVDGKRSGATKGQLRRTCQPLSYVRLLGCVHVALRLFWTISRRLAEPSLFFCKGKSTLIHLVHPIARLMIPDSFARSLAVISTKDSHMQDVLPAEPWICQSHGIVQNSLPCYTAQRRCQRQITPIFAPRVTLKRRSARHSYPARPSQNRCCHRRRHLLPLRAQSAAAPVCRTDQGRTDTPGV